MKLLQRSRVEILALSILMACIPLNLVFAFDAGSPVIPIALEDVPDFTPLTLNTLPNFMDEVEQKETKTGRVHTNGFLSTINYCEFKERKPPVKDECLCLEPVDTGFLKPVNIHLLLQPGKAPLAITLLGFGQQASDKLAHAWETYLYNAGCHVLTFDSLVRNNMNEATGLGVAGNFAEETAVVVKIVDTVMARAGKDGLPLRDKITSVRLLGTSYGGLLSMQCLRMPHAKSWPIDRVLLLSTPINMGTAAKRLDTFSREDKPFFGVLQLMKLMGGYTPKNDQPNPQEEALMRAGIGYVFHGDLLAYAKKNIERYDPELPARLKEWDERVDQREQHEEMIQSLKERHAKELAELDETKMSRSKDEYEQARKSLADRHKVQLIVAKRRSSDISEWNFQDYVFLLLKPYWKLKRGSDISVTLHDLMKGAPNFVQAVVAADDPLNDPKELTEVVKSLPPEKLLVIPHGGHLGFAATHWTETLIGNFFGSGKGHIGTK